jgi:hypothetical protein
MTLRTLAPTALCFAAVFSIGAQEVRVEVVKHADGRPIPGTLLTLLHERDSTQLGRFSDEAGRATFNAPRRGGYRIRAERVGYDTWTSVVLHPASSPTRVRAGMKLRSLRLPPVTGTTETHCSALGDQMGAAGDMWGEISKALAANKVTESQGLVSLELETYERLLDPRGVVLSEQGDRRVGNSSQPYRSGGTLQFAAAGEQRPAFNAPDASGLLSPDFVASHCFSAVRGVGAENGLLGLEFKPAKLGDKADISGVLWLDPSTYSLRHLAFDFVNIPAPLRAGRATGRLDFQHLRGGEWIVSRWQVRTPRAGNAPATIAGYHERGGVARPTGSARHEPVPVVTTPASTEGPRITGTVFDGTVGAPVAGVEVTTTSGRYRTTTNRGGGYELAVDDGLVDTLIFDHPRLRLLRIPRVRPVAVRSGTKTQVTIMIPTFTALRQAHCATQRSTPPSGLAVGFVRDVAGNPVPNALVSAKWQVQWIEENGRLVAARQLRAVDTQTAADGSYLLCGFTRDAQVTLRVTVDGTPRVEETIPFPRGMVLERDIRLPAR